jgi:uncharacterized metal-binding protein
VSNDVDEFIRRIKTCIFNDYAAGVIGEVIPVIQLVKSGRPIIAIDGCSLGCTKACLQGKNIKIDHYFDLSEYGFEKRSKWDDSLAENTVPMANIYKTLYDKGIKFSSDNHHS